MHIAEKIAHYISAEASFCPQAAKPSAKKGISPAAARRSADALTFGHESVVIFLSTLVIALEIGFPTIMVLKGSDVPVIPGFILILVTSVIFLKLVSYVHCNWDLR